MTLRDTPKMKMCRGRSETCPLQKLFTEGVVIHGH